MRLETFFNNFELLVDAPNGVKKLRELILQLAVQGKLVPQDPNDEPASLLIEKLKVKKEQLIREKKIRRSKPLPPIELNEIPFELSEHWEWIRLGEVGDWGAGATPDRKNIEYYGGSITWFKSGELNDGYIRDSEEKITELALQKYSLRLNRPEDVLIAMYGATIGKVAVLETSATTNQAVCACTCFQGFYNRYLFILLKAYKNYFFNQGAGGAQPNISREKIIHTVAPLPPLKEQKRIVAKVDQLMALCDELKTRQRHRREDCVHLNNAAIAQLLTTREPNDFSKHWQSICDNFDLLYSVPENLGKLRQAILQLAVQGKLVPQDPSDEPVSVLLEKITAEKEWLIKEKKIKKIEILPPIELENIPFKLVKGWKWARFCDIATIASNLVKPESYLTLAHIAPDNIEKQTGKLLSYRTVGEDNVRSGNHRFFSGQILYSKIRPNLSKAIVVHFDGLCSADMYPINAYIDSNYLLKYILSLTFLSMAVKNDTRVAMPKINQDELNKILVPVPPLFEQKRIVAKVDQLMNLCNELEAKLIQSQNNSEKLMDAAVRQMLGV